MRPQGSRLRGYARSTAVACFGTVVLSIILAANGGAQTVTLGRTPDLVLGEGDAVSFFRIGSVEERDGRIVVADQGLHEVFVFRHDGALERTMGGEGKGPGEFAALSWSMPTDAGIVAYDRVLRRLTLFSYESKVLETFTLSSSDSIAYAAPIGAFPDGNLLVLGESGTPGARLGDGVVRPRNRLAEFSRGGALVAVLLPTFLGSERYRARNESGRILSVPAVFSLPSVVRSGPDFVAAGENRGPTIQVIDRSSRDVLRIPLDIEPRSVSEADVAALIDELTSRAESGSEMLRGLLRDSPVPETLPFYDDIRITREGEVWIRKYVAPGDAESAWIRLSRDGRRLGTAVLPPQFVPWVIDRNRALGVWTDEFDVESIRWYPLVDAPREPTRQGDDPRSSG